MVFISTLTSKNQTTIPKAVIEALGAQPSSKLCFDLEPDGRVVLTAKSATFGQLAGTFPKRPRRKPASLEEMQRAIRAGAVKRMSRAK